LRAFFLVGVGESNGATAPGRIKREPQTTVWSSTEIRNSPRPPKGDPQKRTRPGFGRASKCIQTRSLVTTATTAAAATAPATAAVAAATSTATTATAA